MKRFPIRDPMWRDDDMRSVSVACRKAPTAKDPNHVSCAPRTSDPTFIWDGADNFAFRPFAQTAGIVVSGESTNVNSMDEVPDSSWFRNRNVQTMSLEELARGPCADAQILDGTSAADGSWVIDKGKMGGTVAGFRIVVPGKGKYLLKLDPPDEADRSSAASVIGAALLHAAGYSTACEQIVWARPSVFKLTPGLKTKMNLGVEKDLDQAALDEMFRDAKKRDGFVRFEASAWLQGHTIGPFLYEGTRSDDPNDVVPHEDRRDLRGLRVLAAWLGRYDARAPNTLDSWMADDKKHPESSPGHVEHFQLDTSECFGAGYNVDELDRRLNYVYILDWGDTALDFITLGARTRPWDVQTRAPVFNFYDAEHFVPDEWKAEYPNSAFSRMTERDGAWMARILARFTPEMIHAIVKRGELPQADQLENILAKRLDATLARYLSRVSPIADVRLDANRLCAVDLAERRGLPGTYRYAARLDPGGAIAVERRGRGEICVTLPEVRAYVRVFVEDGHAKGPLVVHVAGSRIVGLERPD